MKTLIILRAVPGAGKSTFAETLAAGKDAVICSADDFFMTDGVYQFDPNKLYQAHMWCQNKAYDAMKEGKELVIISNTNVRTQDMKPYIHHAEKFNYMWFSVIIENRHGNSTIHGVPEDKINQMAATLEKNIKLKP